jgi:general secretion pathway protein G
MGIVRVLEELNGILARLLFGGMILVCVFPLHWPLDKQRYRHVRASTQIRSFLTALENYEADCGGYPTTAEGLKALRVNPGNAGWHGPYLEQDISVDPWGRPYLYRHGGARAKPPEIVSYGADGKPGGRYFDTDISDRTLFAPIPETAEEARARCVKTFVFVGICVLLLSFVVCPISWSNLRPHRKPHRP